MRSSPSTLHNHYLKKDDEDLMEDEEPEPKPKQQQEIINKINKILVEKPITKEVEPQLTKNVESIKNEKLTDEEQKIKYENKKEFLRECNNKNKCYPTLSQ